MKKRILSILTVLALCLGLLPTAAFAADGDKAIMLGTNGISGYDSTNGYDYIYFGNWEALDQYTTTGPIKWRVLDDQTNTEKPGLFLLSDVLFGKGNKYGGGVCFRQDRSSNAWQGSDAQKWCQNFYSSSFSTGEQGAVLATTKTDEAYKATSGGPYGVSQLEGDTVFFLSAEEVENEVYGFIDNAARRAYFGNTRNWGAWWLRSPVEQQSSKDVAGTITRSPTSTAGSLSGNRVHSDNYTARPAFNLNLDDVLFTSAAVGGKSATGMESGLTAVDDYDGSEWKLTLLDSSRNFGVTETDISGDPGDTITLHYTGATIGDNEYISVILAAESGVQYYGRIAKATTAEGEISLAIPDTLAEGTYTLNVFNEQCNGDYKTDYASAFAKVTLTVDITAPTLSNGSATRDSETTATVKFTSDEAGSYYYAVVESGATTPTIDTTGTGTACDTTEQTISLTNLSGMGAKDIYIIVKDAVGNVSQQLKITIPAIYTLTVNLNGGSGNTTGGQYPAGKVVNIDAGSRSNYRFTGWTTSNGGSFADASSASTTFTMPAADTTITANWQYDSPYIPPTKPDGPSTGTSDGWEDIREEIADADRGDTIAIDMNGETEVPGEIFEEVAGKDVTVEFELEDGISWTVNGQDIPTATDFSDLDLGVDLGTKGISVDVINSVTGELGSVQITLAHDGEFGFALTLTAPLGKENAGYWANLYHYDEAGKTLNFETSAQIDDEGDVALRMTHASQYAIVIDDKSHDLPFKDLGENQWYESAVRYAYTHDIMEGMSATKFSPNISLTRAQAVQVLYNLEGQPAVSDSTTFPDLVEEWYKPAIAWAEQTGVVDGYEDGTFRPGQPVNRMEFAQMLYNYAKYKGYDLTAQGDITAFPDGGTVAGWAQTAMEWANGNQLINGHDDGTLEPGGTTTRAQAASILMRFDQNVVEN